MEIQFRKLHENGSDFIIIDEFDRVVIPDDMKAQFAELYCDRHFGIGAEGVLYLSKSDKASLKMRIFRPDAGEAEMCGSGIRCLVKYAFDAGYVKESCTVETPAGEMPVVAGHRDDEFSAMITMTAPKFDRKDIPATGDGEYRETIGVHEVYAVNTGVPHAVVFVEDLDTLDVAAHSPQIRYHETFPKGANVNFVQVTGPDAISIRTFGLGVERETLSCSAGATASAAIAHKLGKVGAIVQVETQGGPLTITLGDMTKMEGPATTVFTGVISF